MAEPTLPYTLTNGTTANASEVQANDQALLDGITDGTKDIEVAALTTTGNCTFGNSSSDVVTWNASLASHVVPSTNTTYDLGSSTLGFRSIYIGASSTYTCRILGGTQAASYTLTLPISGGTTGQFPVTDGSGTLSFRYPDKAVSAQTSTYSATGSETFIPVDGTSAFTVTLPAISSYPYKRYVITRIDQTLANAVTIARSGSDTFTDQTTGLTSLKLMTQGESVELVNDGTSIWYVVNRKIPSVKTSYTPAYTGAGLGSITNKTAFWKRIGDCVYVEFYGTAGTTSSANFVVDLPSGLTVDTSKVGANTKNVVGAFTALINQNLAGSNNLGIVVFDSGSGGNFLNVSLNASTSAFSEANSNGVIGTGNSFAGYFTVPITNWAG